MAQLVNNLPAVWETWVQSLGCRKIPWRKERLPTPVFWPREFHGLYSPWNSPSQNTVGSLSLLQGIFPTQGLNPGLPHCRRILYQLSYQGSPGILISSRLLTNSSLSFDKIPTFHQNLAPPADQTMSPDSVTISGFYFHHGIAQPVLFRVSLILPRPCEYRSLFRVLFSSVL